MTESTCHEYRRHLKPHTYTMQFAKSFVNFDLSYLGEFIHPTFQEKAEIGLLEHIGRKEHSQAKLVHNNLRRFAIWVGAENRYADLKAIENPGHPPSEKRWHEAFREYTINTIGVGRYVGRDLSACWRGLINLRDNGLPLPDLEPPEAHARRQYNVKSLSLRICSENLERTRKDLGSLLSLIQSVSDSALEDAIRRISAKPELRNYCEISRFAEQIELSAKSA